MPGVLYARVSGNWVPISTIDSGGTGGGTGPPPGSAWVTLPAEAGQRADSAGQARFGNTSEVSKRVGYFAEPGGGNLIINAYGQGLGLWDRTADGTSYRNMAVFSYDNHTIGPWKISSQPHGGSNFMPAGNAGSTDYTLLSINGGTYLNASSGKSLQFRIGNSDVAQSTASTFTIFPTLSCNNISAQAIGGASLNVGGGQVSCGVLAASSQSNSPQHWSDANPGGGWYQAQVVAYNSPNGQSGARLAMYASSGAQWRINYELGTTIAAMDASNGGTVQIYAANLGLSSSLAIKKDVRSLRPERERAVVHRDPASDTVEQPDIMALRPTVYRSRKLMQLGEEDYPDGTPLGRETRRERMGLIADEVQYVIPSAVMHDCDGDAVGIYYDQITVAMLDHVQRLTDEIATLRYRVAELEGTT